MEFKKHFVAGSVEAGAPQVSHLSVRRATKRWHVTPQFLNDGAAAGYLSVADGKITIKTVDGQPDVVYKVVTPPGWYCCHCGQKLNDSREGAEHVKSAHAGVESPDHNNPSGWRCDNHFTAELVSGITPKPEVNIGTRFRYLKDLEARRAAANAKLAARDAAAKKAG